MVRNFFEFLVFFFDGRWWFSGLPYLRYPMPMGKRVETQVIVEMLIQLKCLALSVSDQNERTNPAAFSIRPALSPK